MTHIWLHSAAPQLDGINWESIFVKGGKLEYPEKNPWVRLRSTNLTSCVYPRLVLRSLVEGRTNITAEPSCSPWIALFFPLKSPFPILEREGERLYTGYLPDSLSWLWLTLYVSMVWTPFKTSFYSEYFTQKNDKEQNLGGLRL